MRNKHREQTIAQLSREQVPYETIIKLLRYGTTLHRLAEAQCNGDWPCDNGERKVSPCARCESLYVRSVLLKGGLCPDCRTEDLIKTTCVAVGLIPIIQGDPRGAVLLVSKTEEPHREMFVA